MTAQDVVEFLERMRDHKIELCIDGGWGVDALLGRQTRAHQDLDIALEHKQVAKLRAVMAAAGYREVPRADSWECNFVLGDARGRLLDVHSYTFDLDGQLTFGVAYPPDSLQGAGVIDEFPVQCITADWLVKFHSGYPLDGNDYRDVKALCQRFGIDLPAEFESFAAAELKDRDEQTAQ